MNNFYLSHRDRLLIGPVAICRAVAPAKTLLKGVPNSETRSLAACLGPLVTLVDCPA